MPLVFRASFLQRLKCKCTLPRSGRLECTWAYIFMAVRHVLGTSHGGRFVDYFLFNLTLNYLKHSPPNLPILTIPECLKLTVLFKVAFHLFFPLHLGRNPAQSPSGFTCSMTSPMSRALVTQQRHVNNLERIHKCTTR